MKGMAFTWDCGPMMAGVNGINKIVEYSISLQSGKQTMMSKGCGYVPTKLELQHPPHPGKHPTGIRIILGKFC